MRMSTQMTIQLTIQLHFKTRNEQKFAATTLPILPAFFRPGRQPFKT